MAVAKKLEKYFTYEEYLEWELDEGERYELIDGVPYAMAGASLRHQGIQVALAGILYNHLQGKKEQKCRLFTAGTNVKLFADRDTVVQPDLLVVCDPKKMEDGKAVKGAPNLVIEILSPSNTRHDLVTKFDMYKEAEVPEIWYVDPEREIVLTYRLGGEQEYIGGIWGGNEMEAGILPGLVIDLAVIFEDM